MYILLLLNFLFVCFIGVYFYNQLKDKEDDIEQLYDLFYNHLKEDENSEKNRKKGKVMLIDRNDF